MKLKSNIIILFILIFTSCQTVKLPLCKSLSDTKPSAIDCISKTLDGICSKKNIEYTVLSSTIAEFKGSKKQIKWLIENYPIIICDFEHDSVDNDRRVYRTCMTKAEDWIKLIRDNKEEDLMNEETSYSICVD